MVGSKATECVDAATLAASNPPPLPQMQGTRNPEMIVSLHTDRVCVLLSTISIQTPQIRTYIPPPVTQPEALLDLYALQANFDMQGSNKLLNNIFNIV